MSVRKPLAAEKTAVDRRIKNGDESALAAGRVGFALIPLRPVFSRTEVFVNRDF